MDCKQCRNLRNTWKLLAARDKACQLLGYQKLAVVMVLSLPDRALLVKLFTRIMTILLQVPESIA